MHRSSHSLKLTIIFVTVELPITTRWLVTSMQFNLKNVLGTFLPVPPLYSWVLEHVNFIMLNDSGIVLYFLLRVKLCGLMNGTLMS
jgi:ABC-type sulfate transport system permease subunit